MKKTLFVALIGALVLGTVYADDSSTSTATNSPAYNRGVTYGTQGENKCGTDNKTGKGSTGSKQNKKIQDCNEGYIYGYNATHGSGTSTSSDSSNNGK